MKLSIPYLIPNGQLGTFGTITQIKSIPENRSDFFDVAIAGPLCGVSRFGVIFVRFSFIHWPRPGVCAIPGNLFGSSLLLGGVSELLLTMGDGDATATGAAAATSAIVAAPVFHSRMVSVCFLFENFVGRRVVRRPRFGAKREKDEQRKKNSMKTNVFTDFPLSGFALYAFCRLQKQKLP